MTVEQKMKDWLISNGMFDNQAEEVLNLAKEEELFKSMKNRWQSDSEGYPTALYAVLIISLREIALQWIEENCPEAWFKPMFEGKIEKAFKNSQ